MKRNATEIIDAIKKIAKEGSDDDFVSLVEDISDSIIDDVVPKADYQKAVDEAKKYLDQANDYRDRYINRFYDGYDEANSKGYIAGAVPQEKIEKDEKAIRYDDLFE